MQTPCDVPYEDVDGTIRYICPYANSSDDYVSCRDYCGLGVDEDPYPESYDYE